MEKEIKRLLIEAGQRVYQRGYVAANDGNMTARMPDGTIWATPTGVSKGFMTEDQLVHLSADGEILEGSSKVSSEIAMHLAIYRENPALGGIVHMHPPAATAYSTLEKEFDLGISLDFALHFGVIPCAPYAVTGSKELAENAAKYCKDYNAVLLAHHGAVTWGKDLTQALFRTEALEQTFTIYSHMRALGEVRLIKDSDLEALEALRIKYGFHTPHRSRGRLDP